jgi:hypothetical protein
MRKRTIATVTLEAASVAAEAKEIASLGCAQARALVQGGTAAEDALAELGGGADAGELRQRAVRLLGAAGYARGLCSELTSAAARLDQIAALLEAADGWADNHADIET